MSAGYIVIINLKKKEATKIPLKTLKIEMVKHETINYTCYNIIEAIDIWNNKINLKFTPFKLKRYIIIYSYGKDFGYILDEYIK